MSFGIMGGSSLTLKSWAPKLRSLLGRVSMAEKRIVDIKEELSFRRGTLTAGITPQRVFDMERVTTYLLIAWFMGGSGATVSTHATALAWRRGDGNSYLYNISSLNLTWSIPSVNDPSVQLASVAGSTFAGYLIADIGWTE